MKSETSSAACGAQTPDISVFFGFFGQTHRFKRLFHTISCRSEENAGKQGRKVEEVLHHHRPLYWSSIRRRTAGSGADRREKFCGKASETAPAAPPATRYGLREEKSGDSKASRGFTQRLQRHTHKLTESNPAPPIKEPQGGAVASCVQTSVPVV